MFVVCYSLMMIIYSNQHINDLSLIIVVRGYKRDPRFTTAHALDWFSEIHPDILNELMS